MSNTEKQNSTAREVLHKPVTQVDDQPATVHREGHACAGMAIPAAAPVLEDQYIPAFVIALSIIPAMSGSSALTTFWWVASSRFSSSL